MLCAAEHSGTEGFQELSSHKAMLACCAATCLTQLEWSLFLYVNVNVLWFHQLPWLASWRDVGY